jgi:hypothetical protein
MQRKDAVVQSGQINDLYPAQVGIFQIEDFAG